MRPFVRLVLLGLLTPLAACFEDTPTDDDPAQTASGTAGTCEQGLLGCSCFPNGTCSADYVCFAGECRIPEDTTTTGPVGSTTAESTTGDGSTTHSSVDDGSTGASTGEGESTTGAEPAHILFTTSTQHTGAQLAGLDGADLICTDLGKGIRDTTWVAVLRDAVTSFDARITITGEVVNTNGDLLANDEAQLLSGTLLARPGYDESGLAVPEQDLVWTGSTVDNCVGWSVDDPAFYGTVGLPMDPMRWLDTEVPLPCSGQPRLYCVSQ
ncbi:MAG: hypothetical protein H6712_05210 [Myxococcales bacterium]|nr:hypothetical protein [Myxococcales bacterium]